MQGEYLFFITNGKVDFFATFYLFMNEIVKMKIFRLDARPGPSVVPPST